MTDLNELMKIIRDINDQQEYVGKLKSNADETLGWLEKFQMDGGLAIAEVNAAVEVTRAIADACSALLSRGGSRTQ